MLHKLYAPPITISNSSKHLSRAQKDAIRSYVLEATNEGDKRQRKEEMMEEYRITECVVNALVAWTKIWDEKRSQRVTRTTCVVPPLVSDALSASTSTENAIPKARQDISQAVSLVGQKRLIETFQEVLAEEQKYIFEHIETEAELYGVAPEDMELFVKQNISGAYGLIERVRQELQEADKCELSDTEKESIRTYIQVGNTEEEKKKRRRELAHRYGVSIQKIGALSAWTTIRKNKQQKTDTDSGEMVSCGAEIPVSAGPREQVIMPLEGNSESAVEWAVSEEVDLLEFIESEGAEGFSAEDIDFIADFFSTCDWENPEELEEYETSIVDIFPGLTIADVERLIKREQIQNKGEGMGALINYDNTVKNKWRKKLKEFINENTDAEKRVDMKVLCLPGMECLEIPLYLELGFRPENIVGVEAGIVKGKVNQEVLSGFQENAHRYGIQARIGKLEKILENEETVFDVVSLDFLGGWSQVTSTILERVQLSPKTIFLLNLQWRRDAVLRHMWFVQKNIDNPVEMAQRRMDIFEKQGSDEVLSQITKETERESDLWELRDNWGLLNAMASSLCGWIDRDTAFYKKVKPILRQNIERHKNNCSEKDYLLFEDITFRSVLQEMFPMILLALSNSYESNVKNEKAIQRVSKLIHSLFSCLASSRGIRTVRHYGYSGNKGTPMLSEFLVVQKRMEDFSIIMPFVRFITGCLQMSADNEDQDGYNFCIQNKSRTGVCTSDKITIRRWTFVLGEITVANIENCYKKWIEKYPPIPWSDERESIL